MPNEADPNSLKQITLENETLQNQEASKAQDEPASKKLRKERWQNTNVWKKSVTLASIKKLQLN